MVAEKSSKLIGQRVNIPHSFWRKCEHKMGIVKLPADDNL